MLRIFLAFLFLLSLLTSCCRVNPHPSFIEVKTAIKQRTGQTISWSSGIAEENAVTECVSEFLADELTVDQCVRVALLNNQRLQAAYEMLGIAKADLIQAGLLKNPLYAGSFRYDRGMEFLYIIEMGIVQNLLDLILKPLKKKMAFWELEAIKNEVAGNVIDVMQDTKIAFYSLQAAKSSLGLAEQRQEAAKASFTMAKCLYEAGNITELELAQEGFYFEEAKLDVLSLEFNLVTFRENLNVMMGLMCPPRWKLSEELPAISIADVDRCKVENAILRNSLDLLISNDEIRSTAFRYGIEIGQQIFQEAFIGVDSEREPDGIWYVGPQISFGIPFFDFGQARKAAKHYEICMLVKRYRALAIEIQAEARRAIFRYENFRDRYLNSTCGLIPMAEQVTERALLQNTAMQLSAFELLRAKQQELQARQQTVTIFKELCIAEAELKRLLFGKAPKSIDQFILN